MQSPGGDYVAHGVYEQNMYVFLRSNIISIPFATDPEDYAEIDMRTGWGCVSPYSLASCGMHGLVCVSDTGIRAFPSQELLSGEVDYSFHNLDIERLPLAYGWYNEIEDSYNVLLATGTTYGSIVPLDEWWVYKFRERGWEKRDIFPTRSIGAYVDFAGDGPLTLMGDYKGYTWKHLAGEQSAGGQSKTGTVTTVNSTTKFTDSAASFGVNALKQMPVYIVAGTGAGQRRVISANDATSITVEIAWTTGLAVGDVYLVCAKRGRLETPWIHLGEPHAYKRFTDMEFVLNPAARSKYYQIYVYTDFGTTATYTKRGTFDANVDKFRIPIDARAHHVKFTIDVFSRSGRPAFRSVRLISSPGRGF